eukprot:scaffold70755_cov69-Phaeocystis_antarctica.AAC.1
MDLAVNSFETVIAHAHCLLAPVPGCALTQNTKLLVACELVVALVRDCDRMAVPRIRIKPDQDVWVESAYLAGASVYAKAKVVSVDGSSVQVQARGANATVPRADCYAVHPGDAVPDHCQLTFLSLPTMLENTRQRFMRDQIYTLVGDILVAVNPFKPIKGLYGEKVMAQCRGKRLYNCACGPHVYAIAEKAYASMVRASASQGIV